VSMNEIDLQKARMRAVEAIDKLAEKERLGELMIVDSAIVETKEAWYFPYDAVAFVVHRYFRCLGGECASEGTARWQRSYLRSARSVVKRGSKPQFVVGLEVCHRHLWCCKSLHRSSGAG
ncbi:hypothetical protein, partial [Mycobacterium persicum]